MLHPRTKLVWLDPVRSVCTHGTILQLWNNYVGKIHPDYPIYGQGMYRAGFTFTKIYLQDRDGWTEVEVIKRSYDQPDHEWVKTTSTLDPNYSIITDIYQRFPVYKDLEDKTIGFHGEIKYIYRKNGPLRFEETDLLQVRGLEEKFTPVRVERLKTHDPYGFFIITKSRFFNASGFQVYGAEMESAAYQADHFKFIK